MSASMRTALLVYSGITVKMMIDSDLGAHLLTMFMVQYEPNGMAGPHDHPFEETYLILEGEVDATFDDETYRLGPGRRRVGGRRLRPRVLATPGPAWSGGWRRRHRSLRRAIRTGSRAIGSTCGGDIRGTADEEGTMAEGTVVVVGGTSGLGLDLAQRYAGMGRTVVISGRDAERYVEDRRGDRGRT